MLVLNRLNAQQTKFLFIFWRWELLLKVRHTFVLFDFSLGPGKYGTLPDVTGKTRSLTTYQRWESLSSEVSNQVRQTSLSSFRRPLQALELHKLVTTPFVQSTTDWINLYRSLSKFSRWQIDIFFFFFFFSSYFSHNTAIDMSCKLSPQRKQFAWNVKSFPRRKMFQNVVC